MHLTRSLLRMRNVSDVLIAFPLQQWLHVSASMLCVYYTVCLSRIYTFSIHVSFFKDCILYVETKCQLDANEVFIADLIACSTCFGHHYAHHQELKSIVRGLLPVVFRAVVFKLLVWCGAEGYVSGLQDAACGILQTGHITT